MSADFTGTVQEVEESFEHGECPWCDYDDGHPKHHAPQAHPDDWAGWKAYKNDGVDPNRGHMERVTLRVPSAQVTKLEKQVERGEFPNRSEAIRTAIREHNKEYDGRGSKKDRPWSRV